MKTKTFWLLSAAMTLLASCSGKQELLDTVPAASRAVAVVDLEDLLEEAGFKIDDGKASAPDWLTGGLPADAAKNLGLFSKALDLDQVVAVEPASGDTYVTCRVESQQALDQVASDNAAVVTKSSVAGYDAYSFAGMSTLLVRDSQAWVAVAAMGANATPEAFANIVDAEVKAAGKKSVTKMSGIKDFLEADRTLTVAISPEVMGQNGIKGMEDGWTLYSVDVKKDAIVTSGGIQRPDGRAIEMPGTAPVNTAVLAYVPASFNFVVAAGLTPQFPWNSITQYAGLVGGYQAQGMLSMVLPYLKALDGTVLVAAGPDGEQAYSDPSLQNWKGLLMAHMPQATIDEALASVKDLFATGGVPYTEADGAIKADYQGVQLNIGNVDGYLTVSNFPAAPGQSNNLAQVFQGKNGGMYLEIPSLRLFSPTLPQWGVKLVVQGEKTESNARLTLVGSNEPILQALLKTMM